MARRILAAIGALPATPPPLVRTVPEQRQKAASDDQLGRFREIIADPLNLLIARVPEAGYVDLEGNVLLHNGHRVPAETYYGRFGDILIVNRGVHEPLEEFVFQELLAALRGTRPLMIELGAYWAHYSMWLKQVCPEATCIMVEPDAQKLAAGRANFARHAYDGEFIQEKVADDGWTLDAFAAARGLERVDILHCDIQGYEHAMLEQGTRMFSEHRVAATLISTHGETLHHDVESFLARYGYRIEISSGFNDGTTSHDGLVFATSPAAPPVFRNFTPLGRLDILTARPAQLADYVHQVATDHYHPYKA